MKKLLLPLIGALALPGIAAAQQIKIGAVDMGKVFAEYYKTKKAEAELKDRAAGYEKDLKNRAAELQKLQEDGRKLEEDAENPAFNEEKRSEKRKLRDAKLTEFRLLAQTLNETKNTRERELREQQGRVRGAIVEEILKVVQDIAKRDGYQLIVDKAGNTLSGVSAFLYVQDTLDITSSIVKELNRNAPPANDKKDNGKK
ncbi:MAG: OmpH family outer membrane protein [Verrucomicrobiae bacterium]|nr:OmpH family outer membrane protein [Verrucomicrobiae bacterium]